MQIAGFRITDTNSLFTTLELWLEALQARNVSHRTVESYREYVTPFVRFLGPGG